MNFVGSTISYALSKERLKFYAAALRLESLGWQLLITLHGRRTQ